MPFYERQPYIQPLQSIMQEVLRGEILVPRFQRPGTEITWSKEQRQALLDSIYRGFPVGTILLWTTATTDISSFDTVGRFAVPPITEGKLKRYLLDGHQRLSTLVQILGSGLTDTAQLPTNDEDKEWWFFDLLGRSTDSKENFICLDVKESDDAMHLPLATLLNRSELNRWIREKDLDDALTSKAENLRDSLRDYPMPVAILQTEDLTEAAESFKRVNSSGASMGDFNMVAALAFKKDFDLQEIFSRAREEYLAPIRWNAITDSDILRTCAAIVDKEPTNLKVDELAKLLSSDPTIIEKTFHSIVLATNALGTCGIHGPEMLPYNWQLIIMATALRGYTDISPKVQTALERWFWITTYGGVFTTGNKFSVYDRSKQALSNMMDDGSEEAMERYIRRNVYLLKSFDFRAGRAKACVLAMAKLQDGNDISGAAHKALAQGKNSLQILQPKGQRSTWWHLVIEAEEGQVAAIRSAAKSAGWQSQATLLQQFGVDMANSNDILVPLETRRDQILAAERQFVEELGFNWIGRST